MEDVTNEDVFELIEKTSANKPFRQEVIPKGYEIEHHQYGVALYQVIPNKKTGNQIRKYLSLIQFPKSLNDSKILKAMK